MTDPLSSFFLRITSVAADLALYSSIYRSMPRPVRIGCRVATVGCVGTAAYWIYNYKGPQQKSMKEAPERY